MKHAVIFSVLLALTVPGTLLAQDATPEKDFAGWLKGKLAAVADGSAAPDARIAARDEVVKTVTGNVAPRTKIDWCQELAGQIAPLINAKDPSTVIHSCYIAANARHVSLVPVLTAGLNSQEAMVRYWSAKGLADVQPYMFSMGGVEFFEKPINALSDRGIKEENVVVAQEICRALGISDPARMTDPRRKAIVLKAFMGMFKERSKRLADRKLDQLLADLAAINAAGQWAKVYQNDKLAKVEVLTPVSQVLFWTSQIYVFDANAISNQQKAQLEHLMLRSADAIAGALTEADIGAMAWDKADPDWPRGGLDRPLGEWEKKALSLPGWLSARLTEGNGVEMAMHVVKWTGGPGMDNFKLKALGIGQAAGLNQPKPAPAPEPAESKPAEQGDETDTQ